MLEYVMYNEIRYSSMRGIGGLNRISSFCNSKQPANLLQCVFNANDYIAFRGLCMVGDVRLSNYEVRILVLSSNQTYPFRTTTNEEGLFSISTPLLRSNLSADTVCFLTASSDEIHVSTVLSVQETRQLAVLSGLTTIATIYSFKPYLSPSSVISGSSYELQACLRMMRHLVTPNGTFGYTITHSPNKYETHVLKMLGNLENLWYGSIQSPSILSQWLNLTGQSNTYEACYSMCQNPAHHVAEIFQLSYAYVYNPVYLPEACLPNSFVLCVKFNHSGNTSVDYMFGGPGNLVFDREDKVWITNNVVQGTVGSSSFAVTLSPDGRPTPFSPIVSGYIMGSGFGIAVNSTGTFISIGNFGWGGVEPTVPISNYTYTGRLLPSSNYSNILQYVQGMIYDRNDNLWVCSNGNARVAVFMQNNPAQFMYYDIGEPYKPFHLKQDYLDDAVVVSCKTNVIKFRMVGGALEVVYNTFVNSQSDLLGLDIDKQDNAYVCDSVNNSIVKLNSSGEIVTVIRNASIFVPWSCTIMDDVKLFVANFGSTRVTNEYNANANEDGYYSLGCVTLDGEMIAPENGYLVQSGGEQVLLSNGQPLYQNPSTPCFYPLMRQTACHNDKFGFVWVTNNWKPPFIVDTQYNPGGDGLLVFYGLLGTAQT